MKPEPESITVHRDTRPTTFFELDHGESIGVPTVVIGRLSFATLGFLLKLFGLPDSEAADMLRLYDKEEPDTLARWVDELRDAGYVFRKRRPDGSWQYVISRRSLDVEGAMHAFAAQDAAIAAGKEIGK